MSKTEWINLDEGLAIFKKPTSKNWYFWIKHDGVQTRKSTKLKDISEARKFAYKEQAKIDLLIDAGLPPIELSSSVRAIYKKVLADLKNKDKTTVKDYKRHLERINEDLGNKNLKNVIGQDFKDFVNKYNINSPTQLRTAKHSFSLLFDYAIDNRIIENQYKFIFPKTDIDKSSNPRDYFKDNEIAIILNELWAFETSNIKREDTKLNREIFLYFIMFLYYSGVRVGEETYIKWEDINKNNKGVYSVKIKRGKTSKIFKREIPLRKEIISLLTSMSKLIHGMELDEIIKTKRKDYIFKNPKGRKEIIYFSNIWKQFKTYVGDKVDFENKSMYSFRHTYACKMIMGMDNNNYTYTDIGKYMGTSETMLKKHYDHIVSMHKSDKLIDWEFVNIGD